MLAAVVEELRRFLQASLLTPVPRDHLESAGALRRRRMVSAATLALGAGMLGLSLRLPPGDGRFYLYTVVLAGIWAIGAVGSGRLHVGQANTRSGDRYAVPVVQSLALAALLLAVFLAGALVIAQIPVLRGYVDDVLAYARFGSLPLVAAITVINGLAEELFFRGALFAATPARQQLLVSTVLYTTATAVTGNVMLAFAAVVLGVVTGLQRRVTGGVLGPMITHVVCSLGMLLLLPPLLGWLT